LSLDIEEAAFVVKAKETPLVVKSGVRLASKAGMSQLVAEGSEELPSGAVGGVPLPPAKSKQRDNNTAVDVLVISDSNRSHTKDPEKVRRKRPVDVQLERPNSWGSVNLGRGLQSFHTTRVDVGSRDSQCDGN